MNMIPILPIRMRASSASIRSRRRNDDIHTTVVAGWGGLLTGAVIGGVGFAIGGAIGGLVVAYVLKKKQTEEKPAL